MGYPIATEYVYLVAMGIREGLLALLDDRPRHGYQLKVSFEDVTGRVWPLNAGQVYTTLDRLERDGLVTVRDVEHEGASQKSYEITAAGREELGAWWEAVPSGNPPPRDELMLKVLLAVEHGVDHALEVVTRQRTALITLLQQRRRAGSNKAARRGDSDSLAVRLVADALVVRAEADLRWLDLCEARLTATGDAP